jgi:hypothetical protein
MLYSISCIVFEWIKACKLTPIYAISGQCCVLHFSSCWSQKVVSTPRQVEVRLGYSGFFPQPIKLTTTFNILVLDILLKIEWKWKPLLVLFGLTWGYMRQMILPHKKEYNGYCLVADYKRPLIMRKTSVCVFVFWLSSSCVHTFSSLSWLSILE